MTIGILVLFAGYTLGSYGVVLLKGYDVKFSEWLNPVHPYQWPAGKIPPVPSGKVFP